MRFLAGITGALYELYTYLQRPAGQRSLDSEQQLAMRIVRVASDEQARREITGG
jgi:hypothetical protein